ncbi:type 1 glutamine amidotransferase domain-containing protein [Saccharopolyspora sp. HNM0983]|uniref:Type 1 glutamine amidotransferase domain-containing protein n=1 Tax=Saccharopolyspora montiporae TaxID=2781240 RepID=A0A929BC08_9PSEU|nr:type 1 glutamine amidotransferase domain-containing protein [Saccharopolyspora sp. HNM0983]MBE9375990.1 type 1 glutamine amidotransferase domain-containing protein [Saccharopolyspora sp. HNM0983]
MAKILFAMTGTDQWTLADGTKHPTGFWAEEFTAPYEVFREAGHEITVATPGGVVPPVDGGSLAAEANGGQDAADAIRAVLDSAAELHRPIALEDADVAEYDAVFYPGGHGPMEDLAVSATSGRLLTDALDSGKPLAVVCHAPAALLAAERADGTNPFTGYRLTAFTNAEESQVGLADKARWLVQDRLVELGARFAEGQPWEPNVVADRNLFTGQNPASSRPLAEAVTDALS